MKGIRITLVVYLLLLTVTTLAPGCRRSSVSEVLEKADLIMEEQPDSALSILQSVDPNSLVKRKEKAKYALLLTQARVKLYQPLGSDSLIEIVRDYYRIHGNEYDRMRALYYSGVAAFQKEDYRRALIDIMDAGEIARTLQNVYWQAKASEYMAFIYAATLHHEQSLQKTMESAHYYLLDNWPLNYSYLMIDKGVDLYNLARYEESITVIDSVIEANISTPEADNLANYGFPTIINDYIYLGKFTEADSVAKKWDRLLEKGYERTDYQNLMMAELNIYLGRNDDAEAILKRFQSSSLPYSERSAFYLNQTKLALNLKDYEKACVYYDSLLNLMSEVTEERLRESPLISQSEYFENKALKEKIRKENAIWISCGAGVAIMIAFVIILVFIRMRHKIRYLEIIALMEELKEKNIEEKGLRAAVFRSRSETLNLLCDEYYDRYPEKIFDRQILDSVYKELQKLKSETSLQKIEESVDLHMDNIGSLLKEECGFLKPADQRFLILLFAGFTARAVCMILNIGYKNFYAKRSRLIKKIEASEAPHKNDFLRYLGGKEA